MNLWHLRILQSATFWVICTLCGPTHSSLCSNNWMHKILTHIKSFYTFYLKLLSTKLITENTSFIYSETTMKYKCSSKLACYASFNLKIFTQQWRNFLSLNSTSNVWHSKLKQVLDQRGSMFTDKVNRKNIIQEKCNCFFFHLTFTKVGVHISFRAALNSGK